MRLYLSSSGLGATPGLLREFCDGPSIGVVVDADDDERFWTRRQARRQEFDALTEAGFTPTELDLRSFRHGRHDLPGRLERLDAVWLAGGNTFVLARALTGARFAAAARPLLEAGGLVYAGYSAGACVAGPDLAGVELMDDPGTRSAAAPYETLGLVPFRTVPHWRSPSRLSPAAELMAAHLAAAGLEHRCLTDGQVLLVDGDVTTLL